MRQLEIMKKIKFQSFWTHEDKVLKDTYNNLTINNDYKWKDIEIVSENHDYLIVQGSTEQKIYDYANVIVFQYEPVFFRKEFYNQTFLKNNNFYGYYDIDNYFPLDHWNIEATYQDLLNINNENKFDRVSGLFSGDTRLEGHQDRINFIIHYLDNTNFYDSYLTTKYHRLHICNNIKNLKTYRGIIDSNLYPYSHYKYIFAGENCYEKNYFTEKILRGILCGCVTFYSGCPNIEDFIDPRCYIKIDLKHPQQALQIIEDSVKNGEWEKRINIINKQKEVLMNDNNMLEILNKLIINGELPKWTTLKKI